MLVVLSGSSGVGKNTIIQALLKKYNDFGTYVTCTTRNKRDGEVDGINYHFLTDKEFNDKISSGDILEHEDIHEHRYGTSKQEILNSLNKYKVVIKDVGVEGAFNLKNKLKDIKVVTIFLTNTKEVLKQRLIGRNEKDIELRLQRYDYEQSFIKDYDYCLINNEIDETVENLKKIIDENLEK
jgi:guanylate kinase